MKVESDGSQTVRAFVDGDRVNLLVADYSNGDAEPFFSSQLAGEAARNAAQVDWLSCRRPMSSGENACGKLGLDTVCTLR